MRDLGFDFFLSRGLYGPRPKGHRDMYRQGPRWYFIEWGDYTLEVTLPALTKAPKGPGGGH
jgi:hypothetical protein